jgi:hypothetical protein
MKRDWRNEDDYEYIETLEASELAWECLRRNPEYRAQYPQMRDGLVSSTAWGLRFPGSPRAGSAESTGGLAA